MSAELPGGTGLPEDTYDARVLHEAGLGNGNGPVEPGLRVLLGLLNSGPTPDELLGESAALEMFRGSRGQADCTSEPDVTAPTVLRGQLRRSRWLAAAGTVMAAAAITVAAYSQALPAPLQNMAYHVLGFVGVPQAHPVAHTPGTTRPTRPARSHGAAQAGDGTPKPATPAAHASPRPTPAKPASASAPASLSVAVLSHRIVAGHGDVFIARLTKQGNAVPGARIYLLERTPGERAWHVTANATTGPGGRAVVSVPDLTTNASFRFRGPHGALSRPVRVIVAPRLFVTITKGPRKASETLTAGSPLATPGDLVILQVRVGGRWLTLQVRALYVGDRVRFVVKIVGERRAYRVVLRPTKAHGRSVSKPITLTPR